MFPRKILTILALFFALSLSIVSVSGQNNDSLPIITADNIQQLVPISTLESSYLGDLVWSDDGRWLALGTSHDGVQVFQANDLDVPPLILPAGTDVLFHPNNNYLASAGALWDIESQAEIFNFGEVDFQQFSPDGAVLFTAKRDNDQLNFTLWQVATGDRLNSFTVDTVQNFRQIVFSADSSRYALVFRPYDRFANTGKSFIEVRNTVDSTLLSTFELDYPEVNDITFSNGGKYLVVDNQRYSLYGGSPSQVVIWDIAMQSEAYLFDTSGGEYRLSPDEKWMFILSGSYLIELDTGEVFYLPVEDEIEIVMGLQPVFSGDGLYIATSYFNSQQDFLQARLILWRTDLVIGGQQTPIELFLEAGQGAGDIYSIDFSPDETLVAVGYSQKTVIWHIESQSIRRIIDDGGRVHFAPELPNLLMIDDTLWDIETASIVGQTDIAYTRNFSPDGLLVATRLADSIYIVNLLTNEEITLPILDDYLGQVARLDAQNDLAIFQGERLYAVDLANENRLLEIDTPLRFALSADSSRLITQTPTETTPRSIVLTVHTIGADTSDGIRLDDTFTQLETIAISPDRQVIFVSERNTDNINQSYLYDAQTGERLAHWQSNVEYVTSATFSPDNQYLLTAGRLRSEGRLEFGVNIWTVADVLADEAQQSLATLELSQRDFIASADMTFTANSQELVIALNDAQMGDGVINGYRIEIFNWDDILAIEGSLHEYDIEHLTLEGTNNASFILDSSLILTDSSLWNRDVGQADAYIDLWNSATGEAIIAIEGFSNAILSPDGQLVAALSTSHTTRGQMSIWSVADLLNGDINPLLIVDNPDVVDIAFSSTGDRIFQQTNYSVITLGIGND